MLFDSVPGRTMKLIDFSSDVIAHTKGSEVLHYMGSLTTPPCSEGIKWYVAKKEMALEVEEFNMLVDVMKYNARYVQDTPGEKNLLEKVVEHGVGGSTGI